MTLRKDGAAQVIGLLVFFACPAVSPAFRSGPPAGVNGSIASSGNSCQLCHGFDVGSGSVQIIGAPTVYTANTVYNLSVRVADPAKVGAGFQISVESATGIHRGTLIITDAANTQKNPTENHWVNHTLTGANNSVANWAGMGSAAVYNLQWQAPATDVGSITFWAAGNAINNSFTSLGDTIYLTNVTALFGGTGACCDDGNGACTESQMQAACEGGGGRFGTVDSTCATINPPCVAPFGACCNDGTGVCTENQTQSACEGSGGRYGGDNSTCATINSACIAPPTGGACCDTVRGGECTPNRSQAACEADGFRYGGDNSTCGTINPPCDTPLSISLEPVVTGLSSPIDLTSPNDGSGRIFIADQAGQIRVVDAGGNLLPTPFLDVTAKLVNVNGFYDERGLLGMTFHPNYASNGRFFIRYSASRAGDPNENCNAPCGFIVGCHEEILAEYHVMGDPLTSNVADPGSEIILFRVDKPEFNHNSGQVAFGPDGHLYWTFGDGGGANDDQQLSGVCDAGYCSGDSSTCSCNGINPPACSVSAQDCPDLTPCVSCSGHCPAGLGACGDGSVCVAGTPSPHGPGGNGQNRFAKLGKLHRIDVDSPPQPPLPYAIPLDNPFADGVNGLPEIFAYGMRNPFKFSFDSGPGGDNRLYLADVGQDAFEEVDIVVKGGNYGWVIREALHCFDSLNPINPPPSCAMVGSLGEPLLDPVMEYAHPFPCLNDSQCASLGLTCGANGLCENEGGISIIGGFVYRGSGCPSLSGRYIFGDFAANFFTPSGRLYYFDTTGPNAYKRRQFFLAPNNAPLGLFLKSFGRDGNGELYVLASTALGPFGTGGGVFRIVPPIPAAVGESPRYISVDPPPSPEPYALLVAPDCPSATAKYLGAPAGPNHIAYLVDNPVDAAHLTSAQWGRPVHVTGADVAPSANYTVHVDCGPSGSPALSGGTLVTTRSWGDVTEPYNPPSNTDQPDFADIAAIVSTFKNVPGSLPPPRVDLVGDGLGPLCIPGGGIDFRDISADVEAFKGFIYPCATPCP